jgi:hypothetical protein
MNHRCPKKWNTQPSYLWTYQNHTIPAGGMQYSKKLKEWKIDGKMLLLITNFTKDRCFRITVGNTFSTKMTIENGIVQGARSKCDLFPYRNDGHLQRNGKTNKNYRIRG